MNPYIGHSAQLSGVQEYRLTGGRGDGMRMLSVRNGKGLDFEISLDRCADISRLSAGGVNMGYFAPSGYVHPAYYDGKGAGFLKSFTAGFFTTCGLTAVGSPCTDEGEELPLHGTISNTPSIRHAAFEEDDAIIIEAEVHDAALFAHKLRLVRKYTVSKKENKITLSDTITNIGSTPSPLLLLYHCNMGYPLLSETARVDIPSSGIRGRDALAAGDIPTCLEMEKPQKGYTERCFYHDTKERDGVSACGIYNSTIGRGMVMHYKKDTLGFFTEWKMMGEGEYVLGLEPGNCTPDGRDVMRKNGTLTTLASGEEYKTEVSFTFIEGEAAYEKQLGE